MALSMTGYGRSTAVTGEVEVTVEVRTLNHRYLEISPRIPSPYSSLEPLIRDTARQYIKRGKADVTVNVKDRRERVRKLTINETVLRGYLEVEKELKEKFGLSGSLDIEKALTLGGVLTIEDVEPQDDPVAEMVLTSLKEAFQEVSEMRRSEGKAITQYLRKGKGKLLSIMGSIEGLSEENKEMMGQKLKERINEFLGYSGSSLDDSGERLATEIAILADKLDVSEEVKRIGSHLEQFEGTLQLRGESVGRKLDFIIQELNREFNTIGAKSQSPEIPALVIEGKAHLEKMREQVQNLE